MKYKSYAVIILVDILKWITAFNEQSLALFSALPCYMYSRLIHTDPPTLPHNSIQACITMEKKI